jgi:hypothetical protein
LLLLTVIILFAQGLITANLIEEPIDDLIDLFGVYWARVMPLDRRGNLAVQAR